MAPGVPYWDVSSQMLVEAATSDGRAGLFLLDTGASTSLLSLDLVETGASGPRLGEPADVRAYGGKLREARTVRGVRLRFQGLESEPSLTAADLTQRSLLGGVEVSGYLGLDVLARAVITIDTKGRRVAVARPGKH